MFQGKTPLKNKGEKHRLDMLSPFLDRFVNRFDTWSHQAIIKNKLQYLRVKPGDDNHEIVSLELIEAHIAGDTTLSVYATDEFYCSVWCCWDADEGVTGLDEIEEVLKRLDLHPVREGARPGRDGHMWLFFKESIPAQELIDFNNELREALELDSRLEFYPAADKTGHAGRFSQMRLPLGVHRKPGADMCRGLFSDANSDTESQLEFINSQPFDDVMPVKRIAKLGAAKREKLEAERIAEEARRQAERQLQSYEPFEKVDLLKVIPASERKLRKGWWITQCPACAASGHDSSGDNLHINADDGTFFKCWEGHVSGGHTTLEIIRACA